MNLHKGEMRLHPLFSFLQPPSPKDELTPPTISLEGPFLLEKEALKSPVQYHDLLKQTWFHFNLIINRDLLITCPDPFYYQRDDVRLEAGITHHAHQLELFVQDQSHIEPLAIDHFILLNTRDIRCLQSYFEEFPLKPTEIQSIIPHSSTSR